MVTKTTQRQISETSHNFNSFLNQPRAHEVTSTCLNVNQAPTSGSPTRQNSAATMPQDGGALQRRKSAKKASFKSRKRTTSPYGLRRQSSLPITERDHSSFNQSKHSRPVAMAISRQSSQTEPVVKPLSPSNGVISLATPKQGTSSLATEETLTRVSLHNTMATSKQALSTNCENKQPEGATAACNHGDESVVPGNEVGDNSGFLYQLHVYGVLLRMMGDQLDADYGNHGNTQPNNEVLNQRPPVR